MRHQYWIIIKLAEKHGLKLHCAVEAGLFTIFFTDKIPLTDLQQVKTCDTGKFAQFHSAMLDRGVYLSPSQFELGFISSVHTDSDIEMFIEQFQAIIPLLKAE